MLLQRYTHDLSLVSCINVLINWLFTFSWVLKASISSSLALVSLSTASSCSLSCCLLVSFCSTAFCRDDRLSPEDTNRQCWIRLGLLVTDIPLVSVSDRVHESENQLTRTISLSPIKNVLQYQGKNMYF